MLTLLFSSPGRKKKSQSFIINRRLVGSKGQTLLPDQRRLWHSPLGGCVSVGLRDELPSTNQVQSGWDRRGTRKFAVG